MAFSIIKRIFSGGDQKPLDEIETIIKYKFDHKELIQKALSHRSSVENGPANERLEYLGDAVLGLVVSEFLYEKFPVLNEGDLTKMKSSLVNEAVLSKVSAKFNLGNFILMSPEEEKSGGRSKPSITADSVEAIFGAVYLDGGLKAAKNVIARMILGDYKDLINDKATYNYKGELLEMMQGEGKGTPRYEVVDEIGPDHGKEFFVAVSIESRKVGNGRGSTKKEAEQNAARMALENIKNNIGN